MAVTNIAGAREQQFKALQVMSKLGMTVHDNAKNVNWASSDRLEVAKETIKAAEKVMQYSNSIDELSESHVQRAARLAQETDNVLNEIASLIENLRSTLSWASDLSLKFDEFENNFANLYKMANVIESLTSQKKSRYQ